MVVFSDLTHCQANKHFWKLEFERETRSLPHNGEHFVYGHKAIYLKIHSVSSFKTIKFKVSLHDVEKSDKTLVHSVSISFSCVLQQ